VEQKSTELAQQKARDAVIQLQKSGDLKAVARALGGEEKTTQPFSRDGAAEGIGSASMVADAFTKETGAIIGPVNAGDRFVVAKVTQKIPPDMSKLGTDRAGIVERLKQKKAAERKDLFEDGLVSQLVKSGKVKIHQDAVKRLVAGYQS
jgi:hypothetical protein